MNGLVDFSFCPLNNRNLQYGGREGRKRGIVYEDKSWFLKFPCVLSKHSETVRESFASNVVNEYIGSNIFRTLGYEAQKALLGVCFDGRGYKAVCACEDFIENEAKEILIPYAALRNDSNPFLMEWRERHYAEPSNLNEIIVQLKHNKALGKIDGAVAHFFEVAIVDLLINNNDRNEDNWGSR